MADSTEARLLIVENESDILELLAASLRFAGFEVDTTSSGAEAISATLRHRPDLWRRLRPPRAAPH